MKRWISTAVVCGTGVWAVLHFAGLSHGHASTPIPANAIHIARWSHDADAAVSFTFDDGLQCHRDKAMPLLDEFGFKGTFFVIAGEMREHRSSPPRINPRFHYGEGAVSWDEVAELHADGQEIGNHSLTHSFLDQISDPVRLQHEINDAADLIQAHIGELPLSFAYPYNQFTPLCHAIASQRHIAVREQWTDYGGPTFTVEKANSLVTEAMAKKSWLVPMIHGIDTGFLPLSSKVFHDHLAFVKQHISDLWVDTYANITKYQRERQAATVQVLDSEPQMLEFEVTTPLPAAVFNEPLTVIIPLPPEESANDCHLEEAGTPVNFIEDNGSLLAQVRPGANPVTLTWQ